MSLGWGTNASRQTWLNAGRWTLSFLQSLEKEHKVTLQLALHYVINPLCLISKQVQRAHKTENTLPASQIVSNVSNNTQSNKVTTQRTIYDPLRKLLFI